MSFMVEAYDYSYATPGLLILFELYPNSCCRDIEHWACKLPQNYTQHQIEVAGACPYTMRISNHSSAVASTFPRGHGTIPRVAYVCLTCLGLTLKKPTRYHTTPDQSCRSVLVHHTPYTYPIIAAQRPPVSLLW